MFCFVVALVDFTHIFKVASLELGQSYDGGGQTIALNDVGQCIFKNPQKLTTQLQN